MRIKYILFIFVFFALANLSQAQVSVGQIAPDFSFKDANNKNKETKLSNFRGKITIVQFWASWSLPCRRVNAEQVKLYKKYNKKGLEIVAMSLDKKEERFKETIKKDGIKYRCGNDILEMESTIVSLYGMKEIPYRFLLDATGKVVLRDPDDATIEDYLNKTIAK